MSWRERASEWWAIYSLAVGCAGCAAAIARALMEGLLRWHP